MTWWSKIERPSEKFDSQEKSITFRSSWEHRVAKMLEFMVDHHAIQKWTYEQKTFHFDQVKKGNMAYIPDFWVLFNDNTEAILEVKGYMDQRSGTKLKRFLQFYPDQNLILICNHKNFYEFMTKYKLSYQIFQITDAVYNSLDPEIKQQLKEYKNKKFSSKEDYFAMLEKQLGLELLLKHQIDLLKAFKGLRLQLWNIACFNSFMMPFLPDYEKKRLENEERRNSTCRKKN